MVPINLIYLATTTSQRLSESWPWYVIRGAGFVAAALLVLLMLSGIGQVTGYTYRFIEPIKAWAIHRAMALALIGAIAVHIGFLLIDHYVRFSLVQLFVPFVSHYNNKTTFFGIADGTLGVTFGILALYGVLIIVASSLGWINTQKRRWKRLHYVSYAVFLLVILHLLAVGTDVRYGIFRAAWLFVAIVVMVAIFSRLLRAGTLSRKRSVRDK